MKRYSLIWIMALLLLLDSNSYAQKKASGNSEVTVLSFNILGGRNTTGEMNLDILADLIKRLDPDLVAMQEVDYKVNRSKKLDLVTELGYRTKMAPIFARAMYYDGGEYGEGILSKYSFISTRNVALPYKNGEEPRAAIEVVVELPSKDTIAFVGTHFAHEGNEGREKQAVAMNEAFSTNPYPTILAGDLNAKPGSGPITTLEKYWQSTYDKENPEPTIPSDNPRAKIDYVMYTPKDRWEVIDKQVVCDTIASDHCVYLVKLRLVK